MPLAGQSAIMGLKSVAGLQNQIGRAIPHKYFATSIHNQDTEVDAFQSFTKTVSYAAFQFKSEAELDDPS